MKAAADKLELIFKRLWGASTIPFCAGAQPAFEHPAFEAVSAKLGQLCAIGASGVLHGPNGVGKSYLLHHLLQRQVAGQGVQNGGPNPFLPERQRPVTRVVPVVRAAAAVPSQR